MVVTMLGGLTEQNIDSFARVQWPIVEVAVFAPRTPGNSQAALDLGLCSQIVLNGLTGTIQGVDICGIRSDGDYFQTDDAPADASDAWVGGYTYTYEIHYTAQRADQRVAVSD